MNFVLSNEQVQNLINKKIINPFVPKNSNGSTPIYVLDKKDLPLLGEGGLGSGTKLEISEAERKERRRQQLKNAQRKYRDKDRAGYNARQLLYYNEMKEDPVRYENWKNHMLTANENYRAKKKLGKPPKQLVKDVERKLKQEWKEMNKGKRGRPKKDGDAKKVNKEIDKAWFEAEKVKRIQEEMDKLGLEYAIPMKNTGMVSEETGKPIYEKYDFVLKKEPTYPYAGDEAIGFTEKDYVEYNATKLVPKQVKKIKKEMAGEEYVEEEVKPKKEKKEKVVKEKKVKDKDREFTPEFKEFIINRFAKDVIDTSKPFVNGRRPTRKQNFEEALENITYAGTPLETVISKIYGKEARL